MTNAAGLSPGNMRALRADATGLGPGEQTREVREAEGSPTTSDSNRAAKVAGMQRVGGRFQNASGPDRAKGGRRTMNPGGLAARGGVTVVSLAAWRHAEG